MPRKQEVRPPEPSFDDVEAELVKAAPGRDQAKTREAQEDKVADQLVQPVAPMKSTTPTPQDIEIEEQNQVQKESGMQPPRSTGRASTGTYRPAQARTTPEPGTLWSTARYIQAPQPG